LRFSFSELPEDGGAIVRPVVPVVVEGLPNVPQLCLVDSGSLHNRFGAWVARTAGIDSTTAGEEVIVVGGFQTVARTVPVRLSVGETTWEAPVSFCEPWPLGFHLLGQEGFFHWFKVEIRAARFTVDVEPEDL
jgi:hypothetical protein